MKIDINNIKKVKGALEDLLPGIGKETQTRVTGDIKVTKINVSDLNGVLSFNTIDDLKNIDVSMLGDSKIAIVAGSETFNDLLGGLFIWDSYCNDKPDDICIIKTNTNSSGRFIRIDDRYKKDVQLNSIQSNSINNSGNITSNDINAIEINATNISAEDSNVNNLYARNIESSGVINHAGDIRVNGELFSTSVVSENIVTNNISINNFNNDVTFSGSINTKELNTQMAVISEVNNDITFNDNVHIKGKLVLDGLEEGEVVIPQNLEINTLKTTGNADIGGHLNASSIRGITFTKDDETGKEIVSIDSLGIDNSIVVNGKATLNDDMVINAGIAASGKIVTNNNMTSVSLTTGSVDCGNILVKNNLEIVGDVLPKDGRANCGSASNRFKSIWCLDGVIQTSDDTTKDYINVSDNEYKAAKDMLKALRKFRWKDTHSKIHFGVSAQAVRDILIDNNLDYTDYSFLEYKDGKYFVNYTELYAFIMLSINKD